MHRGHHHGTYDTLIQVIGHYNQQPDNPYGSFTEAKYHNEITRSTGLSYAAAEKYSVLWMKTFIDSQTVYM